LCPLIKYSPARRELDSGGKGHQEQLQPTDGADGAPTPRDRLAARTDPQSAESCQRDVTDPRTHRPSAGAGDHPEDPSSLQRPAFPTDREKRNSRNRCESPAALALENLAEAKPEHLKPLPAVPSHFRAPRSRLGPSAVVSRTRQRVSI
jgi:hypothetical protein